MIAFALVNLLADQGDDNSDSFRLAAGGFYDISRIASSDSVMWRDICLLNKGELVTRLAEYQGVIGELAALVESEDGQELEAFFIRGKGARSRIEKLNQDPS
jgi:prephenate dehydrogenase